MSTELRAAMLRVDQIHPNPRNVRRNLDLDEDFLNSIEANGVKVPVVVVELDKDKYELKMGHRRYGGARLRGLKKIAAVIIDPVLRDAAEDYIEQLIENEDTLRRGLTPLEQADALFGAVEAGAKEAEVARRTGRTVDEVTVAAQAAKSLGARSRTVIEASDAYDVDLTVLAALGEFDDDPEAVERLLKAHRADRFEYRLSQERESRSERLARETRRAELTKAGIQLWEDVKNLPPRAQWLDELVGADGEPIAPETHTVCPGHAVVWDDSAATDDVAAVTAVCLNPLTYGHRAPSSEPDLEEAPSAQEETAEEDTEAAAVRRAAEEEAIAARARKEEEAAAERRRLHAYNTAGNRAYRAATDARRTWLRDLIGRKTAPKTLAGWVTQQLLSAPKPVRQWDGGLGRARILADLLGLERGEDASFSAQERVTWTGGNATSSRLTLVNFAILAACYEKRMEPANSWRQDRPEIDTEEIRADAREWLRFLFDLGYPLSPIEQNVLEDSAFVEAEEPKQENGLPAEDDATASQDSAA